MADGVYSQANRPAKLTTALGPDVLLLEAFTATERLSEPFTIVADVVAKRPVAVHDLLGTDCGIEVVGGEAQARHFSGRLWDYSEVGWSKTGLHYRLTLRPRLAFCGLNRRSRIFQQKSVPDILKAVLAGVDCQFDLTAKYEPLDYCVQYQESDLDFVSRLLEKEGIYYFFSHADRQHTLHLTDTLNAHPDLPGSHPVTEKGRFAYDDYGFWSLVERRSVAPTKVVVDDFDFAAPTAKLANEKQVGEADLTTGRAHAAVGSASWSEGAEHYYFPADVLFSPTDPTGGEVPSAHSKAGVEARRYAELRLQSERRQVARSFATGNVFAAAVGRFIHMPVQDGPDGESGSGRRDRHLIVASIHRYAGGGYRSGSGSDDPMTVELELMPRDLPYRPGRKTPRPRVLGPQTAIVVGPPGDEIFVDKYGRIKVQFHWDREGKQDASSSCWLRVAQWSAGRQWGSVMLPRIGQEVIVEFLDGDPDRPIVVGAVYNGENMPPETLPDKQTVQGIKTRSTKGGGGWNELLFDDKKGSEKVSFRAQKDYVAVIDKGDETRTLKEGNRTTTIEKGNETYDLKMGNRTETIDKGNDKLTLNQGNHTLALKMGNREATLDMGNDTLTLKMGNRSVKLDLGSDTTEAMQSIELKVGANSVKIDQTGVTIKGIMVKVEGTAMLEAKAPMLQSSGTGMHIIQGGLVKIN